MILLYAFGNSTYNQIVSQIIEQLKVWIVEKATISIITENKRGYTHIKDLTIWRSLGC